MSTKFLRFELVAASDDSAEVVLNPALIETIVDGRPFKHGDVTQITMSSGSKFFVKHPFNQVKEKLLTEIIGEIK